MVERPSHRSGSGPRLTRRSGIDRETHPEVQNWSGDPPGGQKLVGRPSRRFGPGWDTLPEVWKWSGNPPRGLDAVRDSPGGLELVGTPRWGSGSGPRPSRRSGTAQDTLPEVRHWSGHPPGCPEAVRDARGSPKLVGTPPGGLKLVGRPTRSSRTGRETHPTVRNWSGDPPGGSDLVGIPSRKCREWSAGPLGVLGVVGCPSQSIGSGRKPLPECR